MAACGDVAPAGAPAVVVAGGDPAVPPTGTAAIGASSFVLADLDTGEVLLARAPHARHRPASALKVLTALVTLRELDPNVIVQGTDEDARMDGSRAGIGPGGQYTVAQLLDGLLLNSGNDAAHALARQLGGDAAMVTAMTAAAREAGALDTRPATPSGLDGPGMASSAYDLAALFRIAMRDPRFAAIVGSRSVPFPGFGGTPGFELSNGNRLLAEYPGALGGKTGFTEASRHTLVGAAERGGRRLLVALVHGEQSPTPMWQQAAALLDWGFALPTTTAPVGELVDRVPATPTPTPAARPVAPPSAATSQPGGNDASTVPLVGIFELAIVAAGIVVAVVLVLAGVRWWRRRSRRDE